MFTTVAIQGEAGSFSDIAARQFLGPEIQLAPCDSFTAAFACLESDNASSAVVPIENSLYGSINQVYDLLLKHMFQITGEVYLRVEQCLIGLPGATTEKITEVRSQREALGQCEEYLNSVLSKAKRIEYHDTAASVAEIRRLDDPTKAAIASSEAARLHGMEVLAHEIETNKQNYTRFVVLTKRPDAVPDANKTSLILGIADQVHGIGDQPGALYQALGAFARQNINLTKLQSRPLIGKAWHYIFYADVDSGLGQPAMQAALAELDKLGCAVTILGSYRSGRNGQE